MKKLSAIIIAALIIMFMLFARVAMAEPPIENRNDCIREWALHEYKSDNDIFTLPPGCERPEDPEPDLYQAVIDYVPASCKLLEWRQIGGRAVAIVKREVE